MAKAPLKVLKGSNSKDQITCDARVSNDRTCFTLRLEGGKPRSWVEFLDLATEWAEKEFSDLKRRPEDKTH